MKNLIIYMLILAIVVVLYFHQVTMHSILMEMNHTPSKPNTHPQMEQLDLKPRKQKYYKF